MSSYREPATDTAVKAAKQFIAALKRKEDPARAAAPLGKTTKMDIMRWVDENDLDLMHHVIILNIAEAAEYLLSHGYFQVDAVCLLFFIQGSYINLVRGSHRRLCAISNQGDVTSHFERQILLYFALCFLLNENW